MQGGLNGVISFITIDEQPKQEFALGYFDASYTSVTAYLGVKQINYVSSVTKWGHVFVICISLIYIM